MEMIIELAMSAGVNCTIGHICGENSISITMLKTNVLSEYIDGGVLTETLLEIKSAFSEQDYAISMLEQAVEAVCGFEFGGVVDASVKEFPHFLSGGDNEIYVYSAVVAVIKEV
jgi:hypothetical protein